MIEGVGVKSSRTQPVVVPLARGACVLGAPDLFNRPTVKHPCICNTLPDLYLCLCNTHGGSDGSQNFSFRLDEALIARIDAMDPKRSEFVRDALEGVIASRRSVIKAASKTAASKTRPRRFRVLAIGQAPIADTQAGEIVPMRAIRSVQSD